MELYILSKMKVLYILNPNSNGGKAAGLEGMLRDWEYPSGVSVDIMKTTKPGDAVVYAEENASKYDVVCAVGGDGTLNEVANGLYNAGTGVLGIIPSGTGNDFLKGIGRSNNPEESMPSIFTGEKRKIDGGFAGEHFFLNIASVGFDATIVKETVTIKKYVRNKCAYYLALIKTLFKYKDIEYERNVLLNGMNFNEEKKYIKKDGKLLLFAVGIGKYYGGGFPILPQAVMDDGYLDTCMVDNIPRPVLLRVFPSIFTASHVKHKKYVTMEHLKECDIFIKEDFLLNVDGDLYEYKGNQSLHFEIADRQITLLS